MNRPLMIVSGVALLSLLIYIAVTISNQAREDVYVNAEQRGEFLFTTMTNQIGDYLYLHDLEQILSLIHI